VYRPSDSKVETYADRMPVPYPDELGYADEKEFFPAQCRTNRRKSLCQKTLSFFDVHVIAACDR